MVVNLVPLDQTPGPPDDIGSRTRGPISFALIPHIRVWSLGFMAQGSRVEGAF